MTKMFTLSHPRRAGHTAGAALLLVLGLLAVLLVPLTLTPTQAAEPARQAQTPTATPDLPPGMNGWIASTGRVRLRSGPALHYEPLTSLDPETPLRLITQVKLVNHEDHEQWYLVHTPEGAFGWVFTNLVDASGTDPLAEPFTMPDTLAYQPESAGAALAAPDITFAPEVSAQVQTIFARGQSRGNYADRFIIIGDSVSAGNEYNLPAFCAFEWGTYTLGAHTDLEREIDWFADSFCAPFLTLRSGFSTRHILDPLWADPALCETGDTPLSCELRRTQPAYALIYIGLVDITFNSVDTYTENMHTILPTLIEAGVIPVLMTVTSSERVARVRGYTAQMDALNATIHALAAEYDLPLIAFAEAARDLPNQGTIEEGFHLSYGVDGVIRFDGDQARHGKDLYEWQALHMLRALRVCTARASDRVCEVE